MIEVKKYRQSRFWAVYVNGELLAVVVLSSDNYNSPQRQLKLLTCSAWN